MTLEIVSSNKSFGGWHKRYRHSASTLGCEMNFAIYQPPQALSGNIADALDAFGLGDGGFFLSLGGYCAGQRNDADRKSTRLNSSHT